ncbi:RNA polymerase sigma factor SigF [Nocardia sp. NPDC005978]|uniref:RNA polymerase sigma factor SigF n=1 Tax=Nocardia sp. NPDC005978 TaxID=3156725 RepID=UPI00339F40E2
MTRVNSYDDIEAAFEELERADETGEPDRNMVREKIIERCLPLAEHIARRFAGRGESFDDLVQVARLGLVRAVDRFEVSRGSPFLSFAVPTIMGEVRRHFRDYTWAVRVPRRTKEIQVQLSSTIELLAQRLGRMPRAREIAEELDIDLLEVTQALIASNAYQASSLDTTLTGDDSDNTPLPKAETLGGIETDYELIEQRLAVRPLLAELPDRERRLLTMRFFECKTQTQIAEDLGVSQMHVSRMLTRTLTRLREDALRD